MSKFDLAWTLNSFLVCTLGGTVATFGFGGSKKSRDLLELNTPDFRISMLAGSEQDTIRL